MSTSETDGPRGCTRGDLDALIQLVNSVFRPDGRQNILTDYPLVYRDENLDNIRLLMVRGQIVSEVPFIPWTVRHEGFRFTVAVISPTATQPMHRHRGYGLKCLNSCVQCMQDHEIDLSVLWTLVPTFRFYNHAAYQAVRDQGYTFPCGRADAGLFEDHGEKIVLLQPNQPRYLNAIASLHEAEPFGFERSREQAAALLSLPMLTTYLAVRDRVPVAYLCFSRSTNKPGIIEAAGESDGLATLMHHTLRQLPDDEPIIVHTSLCRSVHSELMQQRLPDRRQGSGEHQMLRINDVARFLRKIASWLERRANGSSMSFSIGVTDTGQTVSLDFSDTGLQIAAEHRDCHVELSLLELTSAIFGVHPERPYDVPEPLTKLFPFYFPISVLDRS